MSPRAIQVHRTDLAAALTRESALPNPPDEAPIQVAINHRRTVRRVRGVLVHRTAGLDARVQWQKSPPRMAIEHAVMDLASEETSDPAVAFRRIADACQTRRTTAQLIRTTLDERDGVAGRALLEDILTDLATGACSVLEREWLRVERAHGLPIGKRQAHGPARGWNGTMTTCPSCPSCPSRPAA